MNIGDYCIDKKDRLGRGSYGCVFKGYDKTKKIPVAAKEIDNTEHLNKSTFQEIKSLWSIKHANIVELLDVFADSNSWWIILEYCDHGDLERFLSSNMQDLQLKVKINIMLQCATAISYLHNQKPCIVHRDIKLKNILIKTSSSSGVTVKVCDFGFSKILDTHSVPMMTDAGTLAFRAPELLIKKDGKLQYTASVDTFALGMVFKIMLDAGSETEQLEPTEVPIKGESEWMLTYGMTLEKRRSDKQKSPAFFILRADDSKVVMYLKALITSMAVYNNEDRLEMHEVNHFLLILQEHLKEEHPKYSGVLLHYAKHRRSENETRERQLNDREEKLKQEETNQAKREKDLEKHERQINDREQKLKQDETNQDKKDKNLEKQERQLNDREEKLKQEEANQAKREKDLEKQ